MANPQAENGHVDIANEIVEALARTYLSSYESQVLWAIFRKTYGWHKKEDWVSNRQIANMTGIPESHVSRTIKKLVKRNIINKNGRWISFQKDYEKWGKLPKRVSLPKQVNKFTQTGKQSLPKQVYTKEKKETIQKKITTLFKKDSLPYRLSIYLGEKIRENNIIERNKYEIKSKSQKESQIQSWSKEIDKLIRIDKAKPNDIKKVIDWVVQDSFWCTNVLSAKKLRVHYSKFYKLVIEKDQNIKKGDHDLPLLTDHLKKRRLKNEVI